MSLADSLAERLPALANALNTDFAGQQIGQTLLDAGAHLHQASAGSVWYRDDGSVSLRYRVEVSTSSGVSEHTAVARVCASGRAAADYVVNEVLPLVPQGRPPIPWRRWVGADADLELAVCPFPIDPSVPTLARSLDVSKLRAYGWPSTCGVPTSVEVVHHTRSGTAVLRYGVTNTVGDPTTPAGDTVYGKVYHDTTGERVHRVLRSFASVPDLLAGAPSVPFPTSLGYMPDLRLLLTDELRGQPLIPRWMRAVLIDDPGASSPGRRDALLSAVRAAGRALAALHTRRRSSAPVQSLEDLRRKLDRELDLVAQVWPSTVDIVRSGLDNTAGRSSQATAHVLCHGDYTPSQVLFADDAVSGLVDFDTVCWGDPAMDLGRFLAHLDLLVAKGGGHLEEPWARQLATQFLGGYGEPTGRKVHDQPFLRRIAVFRTIALAFSALHACRQLKEHRLNLALSLLSTAENWKANL